jgi:hypothetical protein
MEVKNTTPLKFPPHYKPIRLANTDGDHAELHRQNEELPLVIMGQGDLTNFIPSQAPTEAQDYKVEAAGITGFFLGVGITAVIAGLLITILYLRGVLL